MFLQILNFSSNKAIYLCANSQIGEFPQYRSVIKISLHNIDFEF